ncbi:hypothetical protein BGW80DRAFT_630963 [Lactifluus volemus]|nr:hypothetical protein BGW80DRAFT_630963 [Lactifluus volemus]
MSLILPSILDVILSSILLHSLIRTMQQVYAAHIRRRIVRLIAMVWQSAVPPTLCTIYLCVAYVQFSLATPKTLQLWFTVIQGLIGKLYLLSFFCIINDCAFSGEQLQATTYNPTLTIPIETCDTLSLDTRVDRSTSVNTVV